MTPASLQEGWQAHLRVGEGGREQLERVREADGRPARNQVAGRARLPRVPPVHAPQHLPRTSPRRSSRSLDHLEPITLHLCQPRSGLP